MFQMQNNPLMQLMQFARGGGNPTQFINQMAGSNPVAANLAQSIQGKSPAQLRQMAENLAKERGVNLEDIARQIGVTLPK